MMKQEQRNKRSEFTTLKDEVRNMGDFYDNLYHFAIIERLQNEVKSANMELIRKKSNLFGLMNEIRESADSVARNYKDKQAFIPSFHEEAGTVLSTIINCNARRSCDDQFLTIQIEMIEDPSVLDAMPEKTSTEMDIITKLKDYWNASNGKIRWRDRDDYYNKCHELRDQEHGFSIIHNLLFDFSCMEIGQLIDFLDGRGYAEHCDGKTFKLGDFVDNPSDLVVTHKTM